LFFSVESRDKSSYSSGEISGLKLRFLCDFKARTNNDSLRFINIDNETGVALFEWPTILICPKLNVTREEGNQNPLQNMGYWAQEENHLLDFEAIFVMVLSFIAIILIGSLVIVMFYTIIDALSNNSRCFNSEKNQIVQQV